MGGIKNKLSKLSNKVKTLFNSLPLAGEMPVAFRVGAHLASQKCDDKRADEMTKSSQSRERINNNKGSRLPSFSQPSKMPDGQISNTRKLSHLGLSFLNDGSLRHKKQEHGPASPTRGGDLRSKSEGSNLLWDQRRQMKSVRISIGGFDRLIKVTKYLGLTCLTLTILSTLVLNMVIVLIHPVR